MAHDSSMTTGWMPIKALAFRPFFFLAALSSIVFLVVWLLFWHGKVLLQPYGSMLWWHQHEMLFAFVSAVVAGFLLTAVRNWTGLPSLTGMPLLLLVLLWLLGRVLMAFPPSGWRLIAGLVDMAFLPAVALIMAWLVGRAKLWRNLMFVPILLLLALANVGMHVGAWRADFQLIQHSVYMGILLITLLMVILGGRVIPFFTSRKLNRDAVKPVKGLELGSILLVLLLVIWQIFAMFGVAFPTSLMAVVCGVAALCNLLRAWRWEGMRCWHEPLLWGLHASYYFIVIGLLLWAGALLGWMRAEIAIHSLTIGAMSTMILAMMARVSLGHTGRPIKALPGIGLALAFMLIAALVRGPLLAVFPTIALPVYDTSVTLWGVAYVIFLYHYSKPLLTIRADGAEG